MLRNPYVGSVIFKFDLVLKNLASYIGERDQRAAEYPWVLSQLAYLEKGCLVLDVGCSESILSQALVLKGYTVVGLDLKDNPFNNKHLTFVRRNVLNTHFPDDFFDGIIIVSTIEHVGLSVYGQTIDSNADLKAIHELSRVLKLGGIIILTTPFVGNEPTRITPVERRYGDEGLRKLVSGLHILREDYFYPHRFRNTLRWLKLTRHQANTITYSEPGVACLALRKVVSCSFAPEQVT